MPDPTLPLLFEDQWLDATITCLTEDAANGFPASNLKRNGAKDEFGSDNATGTKSIIYNVPTLRLVNAAMACRHNMSATGTYRWRFATSQANLTNGSALWDTTTLPCWQTTDMDVLARKHFFKYKTDGAVSVNWAQLDLTDTSNVLGKIRMGRTGIANAIQTAIYPLVGSDFLSGEDFSILDQSPLGYDTAVVQEPRMDWSKDWLSYTKAEAERIVRLWMTVGISRDVFAVANPVSTTLGDLNMGMFRFRTKPRIRWNARRNENEGVFTCRLDLKQVN
jgi:hypothetical protein